MTSTIRNLPSIVAQGTSGIWTYRKWSDGTAECWGYKDISFNSWQTWGSWYFISADQEAYPSGLFISVLSVQGQLTTNGGDTISSIVARPVSLASYAPKITGIRPTAGSTPAIGYAFWHTIGRWK